MEDRVCNFSVNKQKCMGQSYQVVGICGKRFYWCRNESDPNLDDEKLRDMSLELPLLQLTPPYK